MNYLLILPLLVSFVVTFFGLYSWIKKCKQVGIVWEDMNKFGHPKNVAGSGGIIVVIGFMLGVLTYVALKTFVYNQDGGPHIVEIFSLLLVVLILGLIGFIDDFLGWNHGGLSARVRLGLAFLASIPLVVINVGESTMNVPFFGVVDFGIFYALILIPIGIAATTTVYNFLAGFNGLEAGLGILSLSFLSYVAYVNQAPWLALIGLLMVVSLVAFYLFNKNPASVFPGDSLTYVVGALIGSMAILGNFEKIAFIVFIPFIMEMLLKVRGGMHPPRKQSFGIPRSDNSLELPYNKIYGLTHFSIWFLSKFKKKVYENDVVYFIFVIQIMFIALAWTMM